MEGTKVYTEHELMVATHIIKRIAHENNVPETQVRAEMQKAIKHGKSSPDTAVQARWATIRYSGVEPTEEEFILWVASMARDRMGQ